MKRRHFIGTAITSLAAASVTPMLGRQAQPANVAAVGNALRLPAVWNGSSMLMPASVNQQVWPDTTTRVISTGGYPGATIVKRTGQPLSAQIHNMLSSPTAIHWHGLNVPASMDGHPKDQIAANTGKTYQFDVTNRAGMYFYHSHAHMMTAEQVYKGLFGLFIVRDNEEEALQLPSGQFEVPLVIQDVRIDAQSQLVYQPDIVDRMEGHLGNKILVNGTPDAYLNVHRGWYRLRLVNASNARIYHVGFADQRQFHVIGSDGGLLASPAPATTLPLAPSERYDILVNLSDVAVGSSATLVSRPYTAPVGHMGSPIYPQGQAFDLIRFDVVDGQGASFSMPASLSTIERYSPQLAVRTRVFELEMQMMMGMKHSINGKLFEMSRIDERIVRNELEVWEFVNRDTDMSHPMHIHGGQFQILARNGSTDIPAWEQGWKDTFIVHPAERVQVGVRFSDHVGVFLLHCHNLEHEDDGMMMNFEVTPATSVNDEVHNTSRAWYAPNQDAIVVRGSQDLDSEVTVIDNSGRIVLSRNCRLSAMSDVTLPAHSLPTGTYSLRIGTSSVHRIAVLR